MMLPADRVVAKKIVGQMISRETLREIAKKPFLGIASRLTNAFLGSLLTFGGTVASMLSYPFQYIGIMQKNTSTPLTMRQVFNTSRKESGF
jgi:hypothetical protein